MDDKDSLICFLIFLAFSFHVLWNIYYFVSDIFADEMTRLLAARNDRLFSNVFMAIPVAILAYIAFVIIYEDPKATDFYSAGINWNLTIQTAGYWILFQAFLLSLSLAWASTVILFSEFRTIRGQEDGGRYFKILIALLVSPIPLFFAVLHFIQTYPDTF